MPLLYGGWPVRGGCVNSKQSSTEMCSTITTANKNTTITTATTTATTTTTTTSTTATTTTKTSTTAPLPRNLCSEQCQPRAQEVVPRTSQRFGKTCTEI